LNRSETIPSKNKAPKKTIGDLGERLAEQYLVNLGHILLARTFRFEHGEIDLITEDNGELVFVEVKCRRSESFGTPEEAVTELKQATLRRTAEGYIYQQNITGRACRFDVVAITFTHNQPNIKHYRNAF
jgi:putative endonuclease